MGKTTYQAKYASMMVDYFSTPPYSEEVLATKVFRSANPLITFTKFCRSIGCARQTLHNWLAAEDDDGNARYPELLDAYAHAKELQKDFLVENGLLGLYNSQAFIFTAKNITDMTDQVKVNHADSEGNKIENIWIVPGFRGDEK